MKKYITAVIIVLAAALACTTLQSCSGTRGGKYDCPKI